MDNNEERWQRSLRNLRRQIGEYEAATDEVKLRLAPRIVATMQELATIHDDPAVREYWAERAEAFASGNTESKGHILADIGKGLLILIATPFALVGAVLFAAGGIIYGAGSIVKGLGNLLTFGAFR